MTWVTTQRQVIKIKFKWISSKDINISTELRKKEHLCRCIREINTPIEHIFQIKAIIFDGFWKLSNSQYHSSRQTFHKYITDFPKFGSYEAVSYESLIPKLQESLKQIGNNKSLQLAGVPYELHLSHFCSFLRYSPHLFFFLLHPFSLSFFLLFIFCLYLLVILTYLSLRPCLLTFLYFLRTTSIKLASANSRSSET